MYKIYINQTPLLLTAEPDAQALADKEQCLSARYAGRPKTLLHYVDMMEKGRRFRLVNLWFPDVAQLFQDFCSHHRIIEAAGGIVYNANKELLLIHRLGFWDMPKGKIDAGETPEEAALREVREETGLQELFSDGFALTTYHTYRDRNERRALKPSHWFYMHTPETNLTPQTEENIEKAVWTSPQCFFDDGWEAYESIRDILLMELNRI